MKLFNWLTPDHYEYVGGFIYTRKSGVHEVHTVAGIVRASTSSEVWKKAALLLDESYEAFADKVAKDQIAGGIYARHTLQ